VSLAIALPGCVTGHLFAAGRRREYAREMDAPVEEGGARVLRYTAEVTDDAGASCGTVVRTVRLAPDQPIPTRRELTRVRTAAWVYPLVPLSLAADGFMVPTLTVLSPVMLIMGD
jgi:hypothetical protein